MKIKYFFLSVVVLITAILCLVGVQTLRAADISTVINPYVQSDKNSVQDTTNTMIGNSAGILKTLNASLTSDISFLTPAQITDLAQKNLKKLKKTKTQTGMAAGIATQEIANLNVALKNYNVPQNIQDELDITNLKAFTWTANYNQIFVKSDAEKKKLTGLKPDSKINNF